MTPRQANLRDQTEALRVRLAEAEEMLQAIRQGEIDALVVEGAAGDQIYTLHTADEPYRDLIEQVASDAFDAEVSVDEAGFVLVTKEALARVGRSA